jgi:anthranilate phosphoribosyltransferase
MTEVGIACALFWKKGPFRDIVLLDAATAFIIAGKARPLGEGSRRQSRSIAARPHKLWRS